jgi:DNA polymerase V
MFNTIQISNVSFNLKSIESVDIDLDRLLMDSPSASYIALAEGHSMVGAGIFSGDLLIISRVAEVRDNDIIVACLNSVFVVKRVDKKNNRLLPAAKGYLPYTLKAGDDFSIEGVCIRSVRLHRPLNLSL